MLRSIFSNWVGLVAVGLMSFFITPFMIHRLGDFQFGIYTLAFSAVGYFEVLAQGIRSTLQRFVGLMSGKQDRDALNAVFTNALGLSIVVSIILIALFVGLSQILPAFFKLRAGEQYLFAWLLILLGLNLGPGIPAALLGSYLCGLNRFDLFNMLTILRQGIRTGLIVVVLLRGDGVLAVAVCVLISTLICFPINWWMIRRIDPNLRFVPSRLSLRTAWELSTFTFWTLLNNAGTLLRDSTDSLVIGRVLNAALITPFAVASRLVAYFRPMITSMVSPLLPRLSSLEGQGRREEIQRVFLSATRMSALASLAIGSLLVIHGRSIILLWVGPRYVSSYPILVLLTIGAVASAAQLGTIPTLTALGRHRAYGIWTAGEGLANLFLSVWWAHKYGLVGVALGTAVPLIVVKLTLQPWYISRVLKLPLIEYFSKSLARPLVACGIFLGLCSLTINLQANGNIWRLFVALAWQGLLLLVLSYAIGLDSSDRRIIRRRFPIVARVVPLL